MIFVADVIARSSEREAARDAASRAPIFSQMRDGTGFCIASMRRRRLIAGLFLPRLDPEKARK